jgi:hypothetical protein
VADRRFASVAWSTFLLYEDASLHECCAFVKIRIHAVFQFRRLTIKRATHLPVLTRAALTTFLIQCWTTIYYEPQLSHAYPFLRHDGTYSTHGAETRPSPRKSNQDGCLSVEFRGVDHLRSPADNRPTLHHADVGRPFTFDDADKLDCMVFF